MSSRDPVVIAGVLRDGTEEERFALLHSLREPVEPALWDAVVTAVEVGDARTREHATFKLVRTSWVSAGAIDSVRMKRLLAVGERHADPGVLVPLARTEGQGVDDIARVIFARGVYSATYALDALSDAIRDGRLAAATTHAILEAAEGEEKTIAALRLAERSYEATGDRALRRAILKRFLSPGSVKQRSAACWALRRAEKDERSPAGAVRFRLVSADVEDVFGHPRNALLALTALMRDDAALREVGVYDWLADLLKYRTEPGVRAMLAREPEAFREFLAAAVDMAKRDYWLYLRTAGVEVLERLVVPEDRDWVHALLEGFGGAPYDLTYWVERVRKKLAGEPAE